MAYRDEGQGHPIILIHGVPTSSWKYRSILPGLSENYRTISVDLIGYGGSAKPKGNAAVYEPAAQARRIRELARSLALSEYTLMFHDMGGLVAWEMLRQDRSSISNLIILNTIVREEGFEPPNFQPGVLTNSLSKAFASKWSNEVVLGFTLNSLGLHSSHKLNNSECYGYVEPLRGGSDEALYQFYTSLNPSLYRRLEENKSTFRRFKGRTLILWGGQDDVLTTNQIPFLTQHLRIPSKNVHIYPENGHFLAEEAPQEVVRQVTNFLREE